MCLNFIASHSMFGFQGPLNYCIQGLRENSPMHVIFLIIYWSRMHALQLMHWYSFLRKQVH